MTDINQDVVDITAEISKAAYQDEPPQQIGEWDLLITGTDADTGFSGVSYYNPQTQEVIIGYRGTELGDAHDLGNDNKFINT